jgi:hypothetical protein
MLRSVRANPLLLFLDVDDFRTRIRGYFCALNLVTQYQSPSQKFTALAEDSKVQDSGVNYNARGQV